jgi:hypothetical protein
MNRYLTVTLVALCSTAAAPAQIILPDKSGAKATIFFRDVLESDEGVDAGKDANVKLVIRDAAGKETPLALKKGQHGFTAALPGSGPRVVFGTAETGVMKRDGAKPFLSAYHLKAVVGPAFAETARLGSAAPVEIVPLADGAQARFLVLANGKPVAAAEVSVLLPDGARKTVKTEADGRTPTFEESGRFGVWVRHVEPKAGERDGQRYEEVRHFATLVADVGSAKK